MSFFDKFKKNNTSNKEKAIEVITNILAAFHKKEYSKVMEYVDESEIDDLPSLFECIDETLKENGFNTIDEYGVPCNFHPKYEYSQLSVYEYADHSGFTVDYEMTSNSELVDLTLQLKFLYTNSGFHIILLNVEPQ